MHYSFEVLDNTEEIADSTHRALKVLYSTPQQAPKKLAAARHADERNASKMNPACAATCSYLTQHCMRQPGNCCRALDAPKSAKGPILGGSGDFDTWSSACFSGVNIHVAKHKAKRGKLAFYPRLSPSSLINTHKHVLCVGNCDSVEHER